LTSLFSAIKAAADLGFPFISDLNSSSSPLYGIAKLHYTIDENGRRCDTASAFLSTKILHQRKSNLHLCVDSIVTTLSLDIQNDVPLVKGVNIENLTSHHRQPRFISVNKEVILCAGTLGTPQILLLR
jgi:choline dehydrogenase